MQNTNRAQESGYKASLTREQFLFHEMRIVAEANGARRGSCINDTNNCRQ